MKIAGGLEGVILGFVSGHAENPLVHKFINSEAAYLFLEGKISGYVKLLQDPTNENILAALRMLKRTMRSLIPNGQDRVFESRLLDAIKEDEFEKAGIDGEDTNLTRKVKRTLGMMSERNLMTLLLDFGAVGIGLGTLNERYLSKENAPCFHYLVLQPNSDCNAKPRCPGCFAATSKGALDYETLDRVVAESAALAARYTIVVGGEPLLERDNLLRLFRKHKRMPFIIATNGKLLDESYAEEVADMGNVITFINTPGPEPVATMLRRDPNVWEEIRTAAENLQRHKAVSGFVSTVYRANFREVSSPEFIEQMMGFGMMLGFYFPYTAPVGCPPVKGLPLSPAMADEFSERVREVSASNPMILVNTYKGEEKIGGCPSARGGAIYVQSDGNVAACPLVPQSNGELNVKERPLRDILSSPYFSLLRREKPQCVRLPDFFNKVKKPSTRTIVVIPQ